MFKSIRKKIHLMLILLGIIIALMLLNYCTKQAVIELEHIYAKVVETNNHFAENIANEHAAIGAPEKFHKLEAGITTLYNSCLNCHDTNPGGILLTRKNILNQLHNNHISGVTLRKAVNNGLSELNESVRYVHEHHVDALKNVSARSKNHAPTYRNTALNRKSSVKSASELDIIQQTVSIQHTLANIVRIFFLLKDSEAPLVLKDEFFSHIALFYKDITLFKSHSLHARDDLVVEELLDLGKIFENSFSELVTIKETERNLLLQLQDNRNKITNIMAAVTQKVQQKRDRIYEFTTLADYTSFLLVAILLLLIARQSRTIIRSINHLVAETGKIKQNYSYRIPENAEAEEEFQILSKALNDMAGDLNERIIKLHKEVQLRTQAEKEQSETELKLQRAKQMEAIGTLAGGIAHDFNNLLTAILGNINLATYTLPKDHKSYDCLVGAEKAAKKAHQLTKQLITFSQGGAPIKETAPIAEVIRESAQFALHGSNVDCSINIPDDLWLVEMDKGQIAQVIQNLTLNADRAMPNGGSIKISCENVTKEKDPSTLQKGLYVRVVVQDQGIGIKEESLSRIFDPYYTTKEKGSTKGSGLGLAMARSIISEHGGKISVQSTENVGTTFTFYLPAIRPSNNTLPKIADDILLGRGTILVMDDESMIRAMMRHILPSLGYDVKTAENGEQALKMYDKAAQNNTPFILAIMDLTVPGGMGGKETAEKLLKKYPDAKLLVSSGYAEDPVMATPSEYGFLASLQKPYDIGNYSA